MIVERLHQTTHSASRRFRQIRRLLLTLGNTVTMGGGLVLASRWVGQQDPVRARFTRSWAQRLLQTLGVDMHVVSGDFGQAALRSVNGPTLLVANHRSILDIPVLLALSGGRLLSRGDIAGWPLVGRIARLGGTVFVDRADAHSGAHAIQRMGGLLRHNQTLCVFPEGTTFPDDVVRPFQLGAFVAAARARATVVPVGLAYADIAAIYGREPILSHVDRISGMRRIPVAVAIGTPIAARGLGVRDLSNRSQEAVQDLVHQARQRFVVGG